jgi:hypothetical protein
VDSRVELPAQHGLEFGVEVCLFLTETHYLIEAAEDEGERAEKQDCGGHALFLLVGEDDAPRVTTG